MSSSVRPPDLLSGHRRRRPKPAAVRPDRLAPLKPRSSRRLPGETLEGDLHTALLLSELVYLAVHAQLGEALSARTKGRP